MLSSAPGRELARNEETNETAGDDEDDAKDDNDAGFLLGPVLALGDVRDGLAGDESVANGRHSGGSCNELVN